MGHRARIGRGLSAERLVNFFLEGCVFWRFDGLQCTSASVRMASTS